MVWLFPFLVPFLKLYVCRVTFSLDFFLVLCLLFAFPICFPSFCIPIHTVTASLNMAAAISIVSVYFWADPPFSLANISCNVADILIGGSSQLCLTMMTGYRFMMCPMVMILINLLVLGWSVSSTAMVESTVYSWGRTRVLMVDSSVTMQIWTISRMSGSSWDLIRMETSRNFLQNAIS